MLPTFTRKRIAPRYFAQHEIDWVKVDRYADAMQSGAIFPPVIVVRYDDEVMPIDGHHRLAASAKIGADCDAWECDGEPFEDFACKVGSFDADRMIIEKFA